VGEQTEQALNNVEAVLRAAGAAFADVVKVTVHLADLQRDFKEFDRVYTSRFRAPYPARTTVGSNLLGFLVEIDVVAVATHG
jgi:enamine deaminase RidA (YjgF/YER057c/UK114 family)